LGTQTVSVWKDSRLLGRTAGESAMALAKGTKGAALPGVRTWADGPRKVPMTAILLTPVPITKHNLDVVIQAGWVSRDVVCRGGKRGTVKPCGGSTLGSRGARIGGCRGARAPRPGPRVRRSVPRHRDRRAPGRHARCVGSDLDRRRHPVRRRLPDAAQLVE